ncbi:MAG: hypothetical protein CFE23_02135 [Flavobacterium sp. BFFFF1]|uniref:hypothetical protein n=1 Tax=Flavobacterium sp. BFFFF1 TaxID=2015557 RepID=UPI000BC949BE|nr:hypothetical protein [Flavobacterium sp. BFFFF1]OYU82115.1 MAG: hypothetical protein CFE23_02135 [Flavobacterium sp. BFFFF1]
MNYPQLILPNSIEAVLLQKNFRVPPKPNPPVLLVESNYTFFKTLFLIGGISLFYISILLGLITTIISILVLISNSTKVANDGHKKRYLEHSKIYHRQLDFHYSMAKLSQAELNKAMKKHKISSALENIKMPYIAVDYKKGLAHNYFRTFLFNTFGNNIIESAAIETLSSEFYSNYKNFSTRHYVSDFAYVDHSKKICIAIEVDEPYTLKTKQPIHLDDTVRNTFFTNHKWIVLRFAEIQVVEVPELCCNYIQNVIALITDDSLNLEMLKCDVPSVSKWTEESVKNLIAIDHRKLYLRKLDDPIAHEKLRTELLKKMFFIPAQIPTEEKNINFDD